MPDTLREPYADTRLIALTRLVLAAAGLLTIYLIPSEPDRLAALTYGALVLYTAYSAAIYVLALRNVTLLQKWPIRRYWIDVGCYTALITLSSGTNSVFFFGYFFPILAASFRRGFAAGMRVVVASTVLFTTLGYMAHPPELDFEQQRFLIRPIYLLTLGYLMAYWGGTEVGLKRRLELLRELGTVSNPRFGIDRTLGMIAHRLMDFFDADGCSLVMVEPASNDVSLRRAARAEPEEAARPRLLPAGVAALLLGLPEGEAVISCQAASRRRPWARTVCRVVAEAPDRGARGRGEGEEGGASGAAGDARAGQAPGRPAGPSAPPRTGPAAGPFSREEACQRISAILDAPSFMSVPLSFRRGILGRLYLTSTKGRVFTEAEVRFLAVAVENALPVVDNIRLLDQLASSAAEEERRRIAGDIHDSVIQPYIGLRMGLAAVRQKLEASGSGLSGDVERLMEMTNLGIAHLRSQVWSLRSPGDQGDSLAGAVGRFAKKFSDATGIAVEISTDPGLAIGDRLAAELFQMISEGLSNVRKHTRSDRAAVRLERGAGCLVLRIENHEDDAGRPAFTPKSIAERAAGLGGSALVEHPGNGLTVVRVEVPL